MSRYTLIIRIFYQFQLVFEHDVIRVISKWDKIEMNIFFLFHDQKDSTLNNRAAQQSVFIGSGISLILSWIFALFVWWRLISRQV